MGVIFGGLGYVVCLCQIVIISSIALGLIALVIVRVVVASII